MSTARTRLTLILMQAIMAMSMLPWLLVAGASMTAFDSSGSEEHVGPWLIVLTVWSYPFWALVGSAAAWAFYRRNKPTHATVVCAIPLIPAVLFIGYSFWIFWG